MLEQFKWSKNPIAWITVAVAAGITVYKVKFEGMPLTEVFTSDYIEFVMLLAGGIVARLTVWAPANVDVPEDVTEYDRQYVELRETDNG